MDSDNQWSWHSQHTHPQSVQLYIPVRWVQPYTSVQPYHSQSQMLPAYFNQFSFHQHSQKTPFSQPHHQQNYSNQTLQCPPTLQFPLYVPQYIQQPRAVTPSRRLNRSVEARARRGEKLRIRKEEHSRQFRERQERRMRNRTEDLTDAAGKSIGKSPSAQQPLPPKIPSISGIF
ncbi:fea7574e-93ef-4f2b-a923-9792b5067954 [Sclerotinia trifoliorum]|uniref:Fea7574e-93ef-4f2b-a923-9792b5067954 n=1 Tax=Sclerotinia trifoliorum TaxID=28548 RepID=A0A8H2W628_9HELO|nr:fea7574e-93ef-4f2b-a923-9792b5067954 [Sclerotinia trifoliorum]